MGRLVHVHWGKARPSRIDAGAAGPRAATSRPAWTPPRPWSGRCRCPAARWTGNADLSRHSGSELLHWAWRAWS